MTRVAHWFAQAPPKAIAHTTCEFGRYKGQRWRDIALNDPDWILWIITESKVLLENDLERELLKILKGLTFEP